jgi:signal transduction histidine kinase
MVMEGLAGPLNKAQKEYLGIAKDSCNQLRMCVNDLLDTTRIETGKLSLQFKSMNLAEVMGRVVRATKSKAADRNIELVFVAQPGLPEIPADEGRITQVMTNLLDNAFKFTPSGGRIAVEIGEAFGRADFLQVCVRDTGRGIPKGQEERVFDRLHQIKAGDATQEHGIGLGLYLCRELV